MSRVAVLSTRNPLFFLLFAGGLSQAAQLFTHSDAGWFECSFENGHSSFRLRITTHEYIERRIAALWPGVYADVRFCEYGNTGDAAIRGEMMHVDVQEGGTAFFYAFAEGGFHDIQFSKVLSAPEIDQQVCTGKL